MYGKAPPGMRERRTYDDRGRPPVGDRNIYDLDAAQHFLADHAADLIVTFNHDAPDPDVSIYVETPDGLLSAGDYYLWPLLHRTATRIEAEVDQMRLNSGEGWRWHYRRGGMRKWLRRLPRLHNLIRIRKATIEDLCSWDLKDRRPRELVVLNTDCDLTGMTREDAIGVAGGSVANRSDSRS